MKPSESLYFDLRGLRYHVRRWPGNPSQRLVLLHGWMDVSASFQFLVDALAGDWEVLAPDWRGYGLTEWGKSDCYWFPDYLADLDALLDQMHANETVNLVGHSLGGNVACLYAGIRPARIRRLINLEGFGMAPTQADQAPARYLRWLDELREKAGFRPYASYDALAERLRKGNSRLTRARADFLAVGRRTMAKWCCAGIRRTKWSIPCSTATRKRARCGAKSRHRHCGWTRLSRSRWNASGSTETSMRSVAPRSATCATLRCPTRDTCCTTTSPTRWRG